MSSTPNVLDGGQAVVRRKPKTLAGEIWSIGQTLLRVLLGYLILIIAITAYRFPSQVDPVGDRSKLKAQDYGDFYAKIYSAPKPGAAAQAVPDPAADDDPYVQLAQQAIKAQHVKERIAEFAQVFHLEDKRVLDIGSGSGYLQDTVKDYVGLDISPTAARYYHKPFIQASATEMPIPDNSFDGAWSIWVLEHVPNPELALMEMRRVVKNGGVIYLAPAWDCTPWAAQGYPVRPFSDFDMKGKFVKAGMFVIDYHPLSVAVQMLTRTLLGARGLSGGPTRLHYSPLEANYKQYWMADSDAINRLDRYEMSLWFTSRGDECLNCERGMRNLNDQLIIRVHK